MKTISAQEIRAEIARLEAELKKEAVEVAAHAVHKEPLWVHLPPEVLGQACQACGGEGRTVAPGSNIESGKCVRCQTCKGTGAAG